VTDWKQASGGSGWLQHRPRSLSKRFDHRTSLVGRRFLSMGLPRSCPRRMALLPSAWRPKRHYPNNAIMKNAHWARADLTFGRCSPKFGFAPGLIWSDQHFARYDASRGAPRPPANWECVGPTRPKERAFQVHRRWRNQNQPLLNRYRCPGARRIIAAQWPNVSQPQRSIFYCKRGSTRRFTRFNRMSGMSIAFGMRSTGPGSRS
jgi:hypothetical protein